MPPPFPIPGPRTPRRSGILCETGRPATFTKGRNLRGCAAYIAGVDTFAEEAERLLPLPLAAFHILMAVAEEDRHGYAILQDVAARTRGQLRLSAGTLYRSIQRMLEQ